MDYLKKLLLNKTNLKVFLVFLFWIIYFIFLFFFVKRFGRIESDSASMVLEASDILKGNVFLKDWWLTGVTFFTTDLLYFILGVFLFGISENAYIFAAALMEWLLCFILGMYIYKKLHNKHLFLWFIFVLLCPTLQEANFFRVHTGVFIYIILSAIMYEKYSNYHRRRDLIFMCICIILGTAGDIIIVLGCSLPIICLSFIKWMRDIESKEDKMAIVAVIISTIMGVVAEKLWLLGGANKNSGQTGVLFFEKIDNVSDKVKVYVQGLLNIFNADFFDEPAGNFDTIVLIINGLLLCIGIAVIGYIIFCTFKRKIKIFESLISFGLLAISLVIIMTTIVKDVNGLRYMAYIKIISGGVLVSVIDDIKIKSKFSKVKLCGYAYFIIYFFLNFLPRIREITVFEENSYDRLSNYLKTDEVIVGYADFWDASIITVLSNGKVLSRYATIQDDGLYRARWFNKDEWYDDKAHFILINKNGGYTEEDIQEFIGHPDKVENLDNYLIYWYIEDISERIKVN